MMTAVTVFFHNLTNIKINHDW